MEKKSPKENAPKMVPAEKANEQIQAVVRQANAKIQQMATQISTMEEVLRDKTVDYLFKVVENPVNFTPEFVEKCASTIEMFLTKTAFQKPETEEKNEVAESDEKATPKMEVIKQEE